MKRRATGIGGIFFKVEDPTKTKKWYQEHLELNTDRYGTTFEWKSATNIEEKGFTQWSPMDSKREYFKPSEKEFMINYRVENLEKLVEILRSEGVQILDEIASYSYGKFVHILDPDGHSIELWESIDSDYDKLVNGRTKS